MALNITDLPNFVIASGSSGGGTAATLITNFDDSYGVSIMAPATLTASSVTVLVATSSTQTFVTLQSGGTDIQLPSGKGLIITPIPYRWLAIGSSAAGGEASARTFILAKVILV